MRKLLATLALLAALAVATPAGAATFAPPPPGSGGGRSTPAGGLAAATPPPPLGTALGSFLAPAPAGRGRARGHGAATDLKGGVGCSIQCITGGVAYGVGPDAALVVTTDTPATIRIVVSRDGYDRQIESNAGQTHLAAAFDDLDADTHYDAFVSVVDGDGFISNRVGSFHTQERDVHVVYNQADVWATPYGDEAFDGQTWFEGQGGTPYATDDLDDGHVHLGAQAHHEDDTDRYLSVGYELTQSNAADELCEATDEPDEPEVGWGECDYAVTAWLADGALDLDARPAGEPVNDYWIGGTMVLPGGDALPGSYGLPLQFSVPVAVRVTWTP